MPDLYDPHSYRIYDESDPRIYDDMTDDDFGGVGTMILLTFAAVLLVPILAGMRASDWLRDRRKLGRDVHRLLRSR